MEEKVVIRLKDYSVTQEDFVLLTSPENDLLITKPKPTDESLGRYYQSDDYISHTSTKRSFFEKMYHIVRSYAVKQKVRLIEQFQTTGNLLDIGAGTGDFLFSAKENGWNTVGVEPNETARKLSRNKNLTILSDTSSVESEKFDVITMWHVLEHVPDYNLQIIELKRLLKKSGTIVIAVPNYKSFDAIYYQEFWAAYDVPRHLWHFSQQGIVRIFEQHDLSVKKIKPMLFDSFYVSLLSERYKTGRTNYINAIWIGLKSNLKARKTSEYSSLIYIIEHSQ